MTELHDLSLTEVAAGLAAGSFSAVEVTTAYLRRIERLDDQLRAFITVDAAGALVAAQAADGADRGEAAETPLRGVPLGIKDNISTAGLRTTAGSRVLADQVPEADAPVVRALKRAGAIVLGKTNLHEFAYGGTSTNVEYGAVRNPWALEHVPGGSSGGSGSAVAAGLCAGALGTDTAGSIRLPASQCGLVGLKPTYGRPSIEGIVPLAWSLDHVGPLTHTVADAALLYRVMAELPAETDLPPLDLHSVRLGVPRAFFFAALQPAVEAAVERALQTLRDLGAEVVDVDWPSVELSNSITWTIIMAEATAYHRSLMVDRAALYGEDTRASLERGEHVPAPDYVQAQRARSVVQAGMARILSQVDAVVTPTLPITSPRIGQQTIELGGRTREINPVFIRLTDPFNVTGQPAITVPCGFDGDGLPIGLHLAAAPFAEQAILRVAGAYEQATEWHRRRPDLPLADSPRRSAGFVPG